MVLTVHDALLLGYKTSGYKQQEKKNTQQSDPEKSLPSVNFSLPWCVNANWTPTTALKEKLIHPDNTHNKYSHELQKLQDYEIRMEKKL